MYLLVRQALSPTRNGVRRVLNARLTRDQATPEVINVLSRKINVFNGNTNNFILIFTYYIIDILLSRVKLSLSFIDLYQ